MEMGQEFRTRSSRRMSALYSALPSLTRILGNISQEDARRQTQQADLEGTVQSVISDYLRVMQLHFLS